MGRHSRSMCVVMAVVMGRHSRSMCVVLSMIMMMIGAMAVLMNVVPVVSMRPASVMIGCVAACSMTRALMVLPIHHNALELRPGSTSGREGDFETDSVLLAWRASSKTPRWGSHLEF